MVRVLQHLKISGCSHPYMLKTCAGLKETAGRSACDYTVESVECNQVPNNRSEIPTPGAVRHHTHLKGIADEIPLQTPRQDEGYLTIRNKHMTALSHSNTGKTTADEGSLPGVYGEHAQQRTRRSCTTPAIRKRVLVPAPVRRVPPQKAK